VISINPASYSYHLRLTYVIAVCLNMEMIAGIASVSQLVAYSFSSFRCLFRLYVEIKNDSEYRTESTYIVLLLDIIKHLSSQKIEDSDPVLPVLIDISELVCEIRRHLQPRSLWGFNWISGISRDLARSAFDALDKKRALLHLYISQTNNNTLATLQKTIDRQVDSTNLVLQHKMAEPPRQKKVMTSPKSIELYGNADKISSLL